METSMCTCTSSVTIVACRVWSRIPQIWIHIGIKIPNKFQNCRFKYKYDLITNTKHTLKVYIKKKPRMSGVCSPKALLEYENLANIFLYVTNIHFMWHLYNWLYQVTKQFCTHVLVCPNRQPNMCYARYRVLQTLRWSNALGCHVGSISVGIVPLA